MKTLSGLIAAAFLFCQTVALGAPQDDAQVAAIATRLSLDQSKVATEYNHLIHDQWDDQSKAIYFFEEKHAYGILALALPKLDGSAKNDVINILTRVDGQDLIVTEIFGPSRNPPPPREKDPLVIEALATALEPLIVNFMRDTDDMKDEPRSGLELRREKIVHALSQMTGVSTQGLKLDDTAALGTFLNAVRKTNAASD